MPAFARAILIQESAEGGLSYKGTKNVPWHILAPSALLSACGTRLATTEAARRRLRHISFRASAILAERLSSYRNEVSYMIIKMLAATSFIEVTASIFLLRSFHHHFTFFLTKYNSVN